MLFVAAFSLRRLTFFRRVSTLNLNCGATTTIINAARLIVVSF